MLLMTAHTGNENTVKLGADIDGKANKFHSGGSVSLSSDGSRVAIGGDLLMIWQFTGQLSNDFL